MLILLLFAFLAGIVTVLSPCILPILPIVLSSSLTGGKKRPFGIVTGFILSFTFFTLLLSSIVKATGIPSESLRYGAIIMIALFGVSLLIPQTQVILEQFFSRISSVVSRVPFLSSQSNQDPSFVTGLFIGISLGLLWTPCVGPILASVITLALTGSTNFSALFITLAYSIGTAIPMLAIMFGGRQLLQKNQWLLANTGRIQKVFGVVMIAMSVALFFNIDRQIQTIILQTFPNYGTGLTAIENNPLVQKELDKRSPNSFNLQPDYRSLADRGAVPNPEFLGSTKWLNSESLNFNTNLQGKVVLVDFWTYTCINCIRTFPYLTKWYDTYKDKGFVIIGVHAPEFEFEKQEKNVLEAMKDFGITYPVVQDNDFAIWKSYRNQYWPAHYLIDSKGRLRYTHFGEGKYEETEKNIQLLLQEAGQEDLPTTSALQEQNKASLFAKNITHETYLGYGRAQNYTGSMNRIVENTESTYNFADPLASDQVGLRGTWTVEEERITSESDTSTLSINFTAGKVFLVLAGANTKGIPVSVKIDGKSIAKTEMTTYQTADYSDFSELSSPDMARSIKVNKDRKYDIFDSKGSVENHILELTIPSGISAYAFTFGE